jgi:hypothetical protein
VSAYTLSTALALAQTPSGPVTPPAVSDPPQVVDAQSSDELLESQLKGTWQAGVGKS